MFLVCFVFLPFNFTLFVKCLILYFSVTTHGGHIKEHLESVNLTECDG